MCQELLNRLTEQEKTQKEYWSLYTDGSCTIGSPMFDFLLAHLPAIRKNVGENTVDRFIYKHYAKALQDHIIGYAKEDAIPVETLKKQNSRIPNQRTGESGKDVSFGRTRQQQRY